MWIITVVDLLTTDVGMLGLGVGVALTWPVGVAAGYFAARLMPAEEKET